MPTCRSFKFLTNGATVKPPPSSWTPFASWAVRITVVVPPNETLAGDTVTVCLLERLGGPAPKAREAAQT